MSGLMWSPNMQRFRRQFQEAQKWLDDRVLQDAAPFVPKRTGALKRSGQTAPGGGAVLWSAPYAAAVYYRKRHKGSAANPDAQRLWFEAAKARCGQDWLRGVRKRAGGV